MTEPLVMHHALPMLFWDTVFRFGGISVLGVLVYLVWRDVEKSYPAVFTILLCITTAAILIGFTPEVIGVPEPVRIVARFLDAPNLIFIWLFGLSLFQDELRLSWWHGVAGAAYTIPVLLLRCAEFGWLPQFPHIMTIIIDLFAISLILYLLFITIKGRSDDLIERRRTFRLYFVLVLISVALVTTFFDMFSVNAHGGFVKQVKTLAIMPLAIWALVVLGKIRDDSVLFPRKSTRRTTAEGADPRDVALQGKLESLMNEESLHAEPGLTIRALAEYLGAPEHRVRALINKGMGYRNFSAFLNQYRIEAIKAAFADPANARLPVLTIAMDAGYNSLAPFNKAFRAIEGVTPSEYRQKLKEKLIDS